MHYEMTTPLHVFEKAADLFEVNFSESGLPGAAFCPSETFYRVLTETTPSFGVLALGEGGGVVGYAIIIVAVHPHVSRQIAMNDVLYVRPEARLSGVGGQLIVRCEREARHLGCAAFHWSGPDGSALTSTLRGRSQYAPIGTTFQRLL